MYLNSLTVALKNKYDTERRDGVHVSDLSLCSRKGVFRKIEPRMTTMLELNFYTSGRGIHEAIQNLVESQPDTFEIEKEIEYNGIVGHVDLYDKCNNIPIEAKSVRKKEVLEPYKHHVEQLKSYMAILDAGTGIILYQHLLNFEDKPFKEFEISMTKEERADQRTKLRKEASKFEKAISLNDPMVANGVWKNKDLNWLCKNCPYKASCKAHEEPEKKEVKKD